MNKLIHVGLDIGSTTVKVVILNKDKEAKSALELYKLIPERVHMKKIKDENEEVDFSWLEWGPNFTDIIEI